MPIVIAMRCCVSFLIFLYLLLSCGCRIEAFDSAFGQHMRANHFDLISITDIEKVVNTGALVRYTRAEIISMLEVTLMFDKLMGVLVFIRTYHCFIFSFSFLFFLSLFLCFFFFS